MNALITGYRETISDTRSTPKRERQVVLSIRVLQVLTYRRSIATNCYFYPKKRKTAGNITERHVRAPRAVEDLR